MRSARSYQRQIQRLMRLLEDVQWVQPAYNGSPSCSYCGEQQHLHTTPCELSSLLAQRKAQ